MHRPNFPIPRLTLLLAGSLLLAACSSTPLVDPPPVVDRNAVAPQAPATAPGTQAQSAVAPVAASTASKDTAGPAGAGRIVYFDYDSSAIKPEYRSLLDSHARFLTTHKDRRITIGGHTDERGGREYNLALGQQRAEAVRNALELLGVSGSQVEAVSFGEEKPAKEGHDETSWSGNRRAELGYR
jgi:peptidoglycan-associated lipoprotein